MGERCQVYYLGAVLWLKEHSVNRKPLKLNVTYFAVL